MRFEEEKPARGISASKMFLIASGAGIAAIAGPGIPSIPVYWITLGILLILTVGTAVVLKILKPEVFRRRLGTDPLERGYELILLISAAILAVGTCLISSLDYFRLEIGYLGSWTAPAGVIITSTGAVMMMQTFRAYPPHALSRYGERQNSTSEQGMYAVLRHPAEAFFLLMLLGIPLMLSSWIGLIGWALTAVPVLIYVSKEDRWRFMNYEWYYEYTREVKKKMIPLIW